jgi:hypothetical protein
MLIYEKVKETTAHLPSDRPKSMPHAPVVCACICCVINEKSKFYTKNAQKTEKKKHLRLNIPFSGFSYGNSLYITFASRRNITWFQLSIRCTTQ